MLMTFLLHLAAMAALQAEGGTSSDDSGASTVTTPRAPTSKLPDAPPSAVVSNAAPPSPTDRLAEHMAAYQTLPIRVCPTPSCLTPAQAIEQAGAAAPAPGPVADFSFVVQAFGSDDRVLFLNSERDYRDQRNLSVALMPSVQQALRVRFETTPIGDALIGQPIIVQGSSRRVRIDFRRNGVPTGLYYYQTHILVDRIEQLSRPVPPPF